MFPPNTKILIVDDMPSIRELVRNQLKALGFKDVTEGEDGVQALELLRFAIERKTPFQLIISDWNMPKMKGLDLLKTLRAGGEYKTVPFILLTSEAERDQVTEAVMAGVSQHVIKPFSGKSFEDKLKAAWAKHNPAK